MKKLPVLFVLRLVCVVLCVCLLAPMSVCRSHRVSDYSSEPVLTETFTKL